MTDVPDDELRALMAEPRERFVAVRSERVKALRAAGRGNEAAALAAVRKPSRQAVLLGDLARSDPEAAEAAVLAAADVEAAQAGTGDLHDAMLALRPAIDAVLAVAPAPDRGNLGVPLRTLLAHEGARAAWLAGVLLDLPGMTAAPTRSPSGRADLHLVPTGSDVGALRDPGPALRPRSIRSRRRSTTASDPAKDEAEAARRHEELRARQAKEEAARAERRRQLSAALDQAVSAAEAAADDADDAARALIRATERVAVARRELERAEEELHSAEVNAADADDRRAVADRTSSAARSALDDL